MRYFQNRFFQNFNQILFLREKKGYAKMFCLALCYHFLKILKQIISSMEAFSIDK